MFEIDFLNPASGKQGRAITKIIEKPTEVTKLAP
jgi:hypothetical protein